MTDRASRPRRRGAALEGAILAAVIDELREVGFAAMTMESVAARAGAGKMSLYRRWPGRAELAADAAYRLIAVPPVPPEPSTLREDLLAVLAHMAEQMAGPAGEALRGIVSESLGRSDAPMVVQLSKGNGVRMMRDLLGRAAARGESVDPDPPPLRLHVPVAMLQHRLLTHDSPWTEDFVTCLIDDVVLPLLVAPQADTSAER